MIFLAQPRFIPLNYPLDILLAENDPWRDFCPNQLCSYDLYWNHAREVHHQDQENP